MKSFLCKTCGTQYQPADEPPAECAICCDERQYVAVVGQEWVTYQEVCDTHHAEIREEHGVMGIGMEPEFAIGQRALLAEAPSGNVLWDCLPLLDEMAAFVESRGGLKAVAISHPHFYTTMVEWAHRFDCPVLLHEEEREFVMRPDAKIELWSGDERELWDGLKLLRLGGHFPGGQVLYRPEDGGALFGSDIVTVLPGTNWVSFMYSYPMLIPLPARVVEGIAAALEPYAFERIYGAWWGRVVLANAKDVVRRSAERYVRALA